MAGTVTHAFLRPVLPRSLRHAGLTSVIGSRILGVAHSGGNTVCAGATADCRGWSGRRWASTVTQFTGVPYNSLPELSPTHTSQAAADEVSAFSCCVLLCLTTHPNASSPCHTPAIPLKGHRTRYVCESAVAHKWNCWSQFDRSSYSHFIHSWCGLTRCESILSAYPAQ